MAELRWILLALGAVFIAALWWWELKRSRPDRAPGEPRSALRQEPQFGAAGAAAERAESAPVARMVHEERPVPGTAPPVITLEDLPEDPDDVVLASPEARHGRPFERVPAPEHDPNEIEVDLNEVTHPEAIRPAKVPATPIPVPSGAHAGPGSTAQPRETGDTRPARGPQRREPARPAADTGNEQKIVAIRLVAPADRIEGTALRAALEAEGLEFGRYAVFHRQRTDGRMLYSVASLLEPGSFDLERMTAQRFPGISIFAVFPGPVDAPQVFDDMLATARRLADRLGGVLQDERGSSMTAQRVLSLREELVHFQHVVTRMRARSPS